MSAATDKRSAAATGLRSRRRPKWRHCPILHDLGARSGTAGPGACRALLNRSVELARSSNLSSLALPQQSGTLALKRRETRRSTPLKSSTLCCATELFRTAQVQQSGLAYVDLPDWTRSGVNSEEPRNQRPATRWAGSR
jgi:hypothetical protein